MSIALTHSLTHPLAKIPLPWRVAIVLAVPVVGALALGAYVALQGHLDPRARLLMGLSLGGGMGLIGLVVTQLILRISRLERLERQHQAILDAIPALIIHMGRDGTYLDIKLTDDFPLVVRAEDVGKNIADLLPEPLAQQRLEAVDEVLSTGQMKVFEFPFQVAQQHLWEEVRILPLCDNEVVLIVRDLTLRQQIEAALRQSEERFRALAKTVEEGFFVFETETAQYSYLNPALVQLTGFPTPPQPDEKPYARGMSHWLANIHPEDRDRIEAKLQEERQGDPFNEEYRFLKPDGRLLWLQSKAFPLKDDQGNIVRVVGTVTDITDRKLLEQSLRSQAEEERLHSTITQNIRQSLDLDTILATTVNDVQQSLNADQVLIFRLYPDGSGQVIQAAVKAAYSITDPIRWKDAPFPPEMYEYYLQGKARIVPNVATDPWADYMANDLQQSRVRSRIVAPIVQGLGTETQQVWGLLMVHAYSHRRQWQASEANLLQRLGNQLAIAIDQASLFQQLQQQLAERQQAEAAVRASEELFRRAFDDAPIGISLVSPEGQFLRVNRYYCDLLEFSPGELLQMNFSEITHPEDLGADLDGFEQMRRGDLQTWQMEKRYITKSGTVVPVILNASLVRDLEGEPLYCIGHIQDIRARLEVDRIKDEFVSIVSHELRTPITSIAGSLMLLGADVYKNRPEKARNMLDIAIKNSNRLVRLVDDILSFERFESGQVELTKEPCLVQDLMLQAKDSVHSLADCAAVRLSVEPLEATLHAAPDAMVQTLTNLLSNAIKYSNPGQTVWLAAREWKGERGSQGAEERGQVSGIRYQVSGAGYQVSGTPTHPPYPSESHLRVYHPPIHLSTHLPTPSILFSVKDQGRGIPPEKLERIFEQFQQVDVSDARQKGGTGLGLAICKRIVQQHGGAIWVESQLGRGSTFYFTVPMGEES